jgi:hypothetical protein
VSKDLDRVVGPLFKKLLERWYKELRREIIAERSTGKTWLARGFPKAFESKALSSHLITSVSVLVESHCEV